MTIIKVRQVVCVCVSDDWLCRMFGAHMLFVVPILGGECAARI